MQFATARYFESICRISFFYLHRNVSFYFAEQTITQVTGCNEFTFATCEWRIVYGEYHGQCWFVDGDGWQCFRIFSICYSFADVDIVDTCESNDITHLCFVSFNAVQAIVCIYATDFRFTSAFTSHDSHLLVRFHFTANDTAYCDFTDEVIVIKCSNHELKRTFQITLWCRNFFNQCFKQWFHVYCFVIPISFSHTSTSRCVYYREIELVIISFKFHEQFKNFVFNLFNTLVRTVDFVDNNDWFQFLF